MRLSSVKGDVGSIRTVRPRMAEAKLIGMVCIHLGGIVLCILLLSPHEIEHLSLIVCQERIKLCPVDQLQHYENFKKSMPNRTS